MVLDAADFARFFHVIHGHDPFPWQQDLVTLLDETNEWPDVLDLPTGSGKTAALDAAVFHLALRFECPARAALRIALVVDRRLVVDDAYARASRIACALAHPVGSAAEYCESCQGPCARRVPAGESLARVVDVRCAACREANLERCPLARSGSADPGWAVVAEVAARLQELAGDGEPPLAAQRLRGGAPLEHDWARTPTQPVILCSTVDQIGSRLLFRGYGVSHRMKPVHAGLLGTDTLVLLDEAHLSEPFRRTLTDVQSIGNAAVRTVWLSATPSVSAQRRFPRPPADYDQPAYDHPVLRARLHARKPAKLKVVRGAPEQGFAAAARTLADQLHATGVAAPAVGVVVNRVDLARSIFENLRREETSDTILLIGRSRGVGRDRIVETLSRFRTGASRTRAASPHAAATAGDRPDLPLFPETVGDSPIRPLFVVATQCLEVGVDLDLDGLVAQAASLDALRQRFGRLNRAGRRVQAAGAILALPEDIAKKADDAVYGDRLVKTWGALARMARGDEVDFGIAAFETRRRECSIDVEALAAPRAPAPVLMPAYLDLWSQTSPPSAADPDVGLFLHGVERASAGVSLVWRSDVTEADLAPNAAGDLKTLLTFVPPRAEEMVEVPLWAARAWLRRLSDSAESAGVSDVPERDRTEESDAGSGARGRWAFRWAGTDDPRTAKVSPSRLQPGDVLVVPATYGGCDEFGWAPACTDPVSDVADAAARPFRRRRHAVRIAPDVARNAGQWERLSEILADDGTEGLLLVERLLEVLPADPAPDPEKVPARSVREPLEALRAARGRITPHYLYTGSPEGGAVLVAAHGLRDDGVSEEAGLRRPVDGAPATEDDRLSRTAWHAVSVDDHTSHVVKRVSRFVRTLDLPRALSRDLELAAFLHDAGKADRRFQVLLSGAEAWNVPDGPAMAKSGRPSSTDAWARAGLPRGWRHEALSVRMAQAHPRFTEAHDPALVLWLIGTHHGLGRPFFDFTDPREGLVRYAACLGVRQWRLAPGPGLESLAFDIDGDDWPALYERLRRRYGIWRLAHLEAILRLADHRASESERGPKSESTP